MGNSLYIYLYRLIAMYVLTWQSGQLIEHRHSINVVSIVCFVLSAFISYYTTTDMEFENVYIEIANRRDQGG